MIRLLILSCGTNACSHIAKILKTKFKDDFYIVGCDINKRWLVPSCEYLDDFVQCPYSSESNYYSFIIQTCKDKNIDWILPSFDGDQFLFASDNEELKELSLKSTGISSKLEFYKDKVLTNRFLDSIEIPVPKIYSIEKIEDEKFYFVKPVHGVGSIGARKMSGAEIRSLTDTSDLIIQEILSEPEFTLECFNYNGKIYSVCRERIASKSGVCTKTRVFQNINLQKYAEKLASSVNIPYIFNMQFMKNPEGKYVCTDLNLRSAGGMALSYAAGWDEISALANIMLEKDENTVIQSVNKRIDEQYVCRHYEESVTKSVKNRIAFDLDGTLLDSRERHKIVMKDVLKKHNISLDVSTLVTFKSEGRTNIDWLLSNNLDEEKSREINKEWISLIEHEDYLKKDVLYSDVLEALEILSKENDLFLITARSNKENALKQINSLVIGQYFTGISVVATGSETSALKAVELEKYDADFFIGDTESDYKASLIANCKFFALSCGFRSENFWRKYTDESYKNISEFCNAFYARKTC